MKFLILATLALASTPAMAIQSCKTSNCSTLNNCPKDILEELDKITGSRLAEKKKNEATSQKGQRVVLKNIMRSQEASFGSAKDSAKECQNTSARCKLAMTALKNRVLSLEEQIKHAQDSAMSCQPASSIASNFSQGLQQAQDAVFKEKADTEKDLQACLASEAKCKGLGSTNQQSGEMLSKDGEKKPEEKGGGSGGSPPGGGSGGAPEPKPSPSPTPSPSPSPSPTPTPDCTDPSNQTLKYCVDLQNAKCSQMTNMSLPECNSYRYNFCQKAENKSQNICKPNATTQK